MTVLASSPDRSTGNRKDCFRRLRSASRGLSIIVAVHNSVCCHYAPLCRKRAQWPRDTTTTTTTNTCCSMQMNILRASRRSVADMATQGWQMLDADRLIVLEYPFTTTTMTNRVSGKKATSSLSAKRAIKICRSFATVCLPSSSNLLLLFLFAQSCSSLASPFLPMIDCKAQIQFIKADSQCCSAATSEAVRLRPLQCG